MLSFPSIRPAAAGLCAFALVLAGATVAGAAGSPIYNVQTLVADDSGVSATTHDTSLVNGWGLSASATSPWWTANNGTNSSTLYNGAGTKSALTVAVPGGPTGTVANTGTSFVIGQGAASASARFLFATEAGTILGWAPTVAPTTAVVAVDHAAQSAVYKGLAVLGSRLYATDFHNARVDVFDGSFQPVALTGAFTDPKVPKGWAPFGIQALNGSILVTYAKQDSARHDDVAGGGLGYVDEYSPDGVLIARVAQQGKKNAPLNAPWGLALAPASFGVFGGDLLVGNFGNGRISAYQHRSNGSYAYKGQLRVANGAPIAIEGLWAIAFGNDAAAGPSTTLYYAAGPAGEKHGLLGAITVG